MNNLAKRKAILFTIHYSLRFLGDVMIHLTNESMSKHSTLKIGGIAENIFFPENIQEFKEICTSDHIVIGNASNVLFADGIIKKPIIITTKMNSYSINGDKITAECGTIIIKLAMEATKAGLSGLEFAGGIPATLGGAVYMNAGAYDGEMADIVESSQILHNGEIANFDNKQHEFGYRKSIFQATNDIILQTTLKLEKNNPKEIQSKMNANLEKRKESQPLEFPNAGSIFKKVDGISAGQLIDECGLKGFTIGGAQISPKHAGFIVNIGNATAQNVLDLIEHIKEKVYQQRGIELQEEIRFINE